MGIVGAGQGWVVAVGGVGWGVGCGGCRGARWVVGHEGLGGKNKLNNKLIRSNKRVHECGQFQYSPSHNSVISFNNSSKNTKLHDSLRKSNGIARESKSPTCTSVISCVLADPVQI